ncbi:MAG: hypothetical protein Q7S09_04140 [bacterium]|nr:hypothetical protein [bacterium]
MPKSTSVELADTRGFGPQVWAKLGGVNVPDSHGCRGGAFASYIGCEDAREDEEVARGLDPLRPGFVPMEEFGEHESLYFESAEEKWKKEDCSTIRIQGAASAAIANAALKYPELLPTIYEQAAEFGGNGQRQNEILALLVEVTRKIVVQKGARAVIRILSTTSFGEREMCYTALERFAGQELARQRHPRNGKLERGFACGIMSALGVDMRHILR